MLGQSKQAAQDMSPVIDPDFAIPSTNQTDMLGQQNAAHDLVVFGQQVDRLEAQGLEMKRGSFMG